MKETKLQGYRKNFIKFLSIFMVIFPWITYLKLTQYNESEKNIFAGYNGISIDFFLYHKEIVLLVVGVIAVLWFVGERFLPDKVDNHVPLIKGKNRWLFILAAVFFAGALISTVLSEYKGSALWGSPSVREGMWCLLVYVVLVMTFYNYFANDYGISMLKLVVTAISGVTVVLTLVEWFYKPLLEIGVVQTLVAPSQYAHIVESMEAAVFDDAISLTFYNPGYFGGFVCLLIPFVLMYCLQAKKLQERLLTALLFIGLLFAVVTTNTTTALYIAILEIILVLGAYVISNVKALDVVLPSGGIAVLAVVVLILSGAITGNSFLNVFSNSNSAANAESLNRFVVKDISLDKNNVIIVGEDASLRISYANERIRFFDESERELSPNYHGDKLIFAEPKYENLSVAFMKASEEMKDVSLCVLVDAGYQSTIDFFVLDNGMFAGVGQGGAVVSDIGDAGTPEELKKYYGLFTGRGYAWVNSLPILKETLLIGKGPGNFAYYFKHFDYTGMLTTHKNVKQMIDKPHSAYIQYATEVGLPAAIAFFGIFAGALVKAVRVFWKNKQEMCANSIHIGAMVSVLGFLIYSIINDSMITVTPIACMIAGVLLASCYKIEEMK